MDNFWYGVLAVVAFFGLILLTATSGGGPSTQEDQISRHMDMCDGVEDDALRIECYEGVPTEHELING